MRNRLQTALVVAVSIGLASGARAAETPAPAPSAAPGVPSPAPSAPAAAPAVAPVAAPPSSLEAADAAVDAGNLNLARAIYEQVIREHPDAPEAAEARRALKIIAAARASGVAAPPARAGEEPPPTEGVVVRREPYSLKTKERLRLTTWEKLDFGTTAFLYGLSVGYSYAISLDNASNGLPAVAIGALSYTLGTVVFLNAANPDRGDLPLALAITSYVPTTTLLAANAFIDHPSSKNTALATATAGLLSVPIAIYATHELDLDPGDTQLVRDSGFWGLVLATTGMLGFGGSNGAFGEYQSPSTKAVSGAGLVGLYGGLGLGVLAAHYNDISLERVRVSTWGGYGGAVVGLLLAAAGNADTQSVYRGIGIGALAGLVVTFWPTRTRAGTPHDAAPPARATTMKVSPTLAPWAGVDGRTRTMLGLGGTLF